MEGPAQQVDGRLAELDELLLGVVLGPEGDDCLESLVDVPHDEGVEFASSAERIAKKALDMSRGGRTYAGG